jgi:hypothetical protein
MDNWIEREARQNEQLKTGAPGLWHKILTAVEDTRNSYNKHHSDKGNATILPQNGISVLIEVTHQPTRSQQMDMKRRVRLSFDGERSISIAVDEHSRVPAIIDADEERCFLTINKKEITLDQFCKYALYDAFFTPKIPQKPGSPKPTITEWT